MTIGVVKAPDQPLPDVTELPTIHLLQIWFMVMLETTGVQAWQAAAWCKVTNDDRADFYRAVAKEIDRRIPKAPPAVVPPDLDDPEAAGRDSILHALGLR